MNSTGSSRRPGAFTLVEMLVVMGIIAILAALLLPALRGSQMRAKRIVCENQLRQVGIAFQSFAHDHNSKFPMQVAASNGGSLGFVQNGYLVNGPFYFEFRHFQPLADILETPKVLVCPADTRLPAKNFVTLQNSNVSYFVGVDAEYSQPMSILAGDGNLKATTTIVHGTAGGVLRWTGQQHQFKGNVLFADGHVEEWGTGSGGTLASSGDFVLPSVRGGGTPAGRQAGQSQPGEIAATTSTGNSNHSDTNAPSGNEAASSSSATNQPGRPMTNSPVFSPVPSISHQDAGVNVSGPLQVEVSNSVIEKVADATNSPDGIVSRSNDDDSMMSFFDRHVAKFLRQIIFGTYLLVLLLILLFIGYRIWRGRSDRERNRRD